MEMVLAPGILIDGELGDEQIIRHETNGDLGFCVICVYGACFKFVCYMLCKFLKSIINTIKNDGYQLETLNFLWIVV